MKINIAKGTICRVKIAGQTTTRRRVFKWPEMRFGEIPCYVFSAPCRKDVRATYDPVKKSLEIAGKRVPVSEVSVPHYDLTFCEIEKPLSPAPTVSA